MCRLRAEMFVPCLAEMKRIGVASRWVIAAGVGADVALLSRSILLRTMMSVFLSLRWVWTLAMSSSDGVSSMSQMTMVARSMA